MFTFVHSMLLWGLAIVGVPVLIHLINMMRHRRVSWAAMEFLLISQKKNRTWVLLKELLLLLLRMLAVAAIVMVVAQPLLRNEWGDLFGGSTTHHIILLDDSFSMSERRQDTSAFDRAKVVLGRIATEIGRQNSQKITLLRFSQAARGAQGVQDFLELPVDAEFERRFHEVVDPLAPSQSADGPAAALDAVGQLLGNSESEYRIVYLVSDFRAREWSSAADLRKKLQHMSESGAKQIHLIDCVEGVQPNLAISNLVPGPGVRAAGVPLFMEVVVQNFGTDPVRDVPVLIEADGQAQPAVNLPEIPAGRAVKERFPVRFANAGEHSVSARLQPDAVSADNFRYSVVDFPINLPVLLIDGDTEVPDAKYLAAVFAPGGSAATGISPQIENSRYVSRHPLDGYRAIFLLNVDRLDKAAIAALEQYASSGGGVAFFLGERTESPWTNKELYRDGKGLFPVPLAHPAELLVDRLEKSPDILLASRVHPIFQIFSGQRNSFLPLVLVNRYVTVAKGWQADADPNVAVIASLRNNAPLAVERKFGQGRVVAFLTTASPVWNNWAKENPSYVVAMLELQAYLAIRPAIDVPHLVGGPLELKLDPTRYQPQIRFVTPREDAAPTPAVEAVVGIDQALHASLTTTDAAGAYRARLVQKDGKEETRSWAVNVEADEGNLRKLRAKELASRLEGVKYAYHPAREFQYSTDEQAGYNLSTSLLYLLILLLVAEQLLAWSCSYHPVEPGAFSADGVRGRPTGGRTSGLSVASPIVENEGGNRSARAAGGAS